MLRAYVDDSGRGQRPNFVFAGFVARGEHWLDFDKEWKRALDREPPLAFLKTKDAMSARHYGPFKGWKRKHINERISDLTAVIENTHIARTAFSTPYQSFEKHFRGLIAERMDTPYILTAYLLIIHSIGALYDEGCREVVEFVFDTTDQEEQNLLRKGWFGALLTAPPHLRPLMARPPDFLCDQRVLPLQAADLYAWHFRKNANSSGWDHPIWTRLKQTRLVLQHECAEGELARFAKTLERVQKETGTVFPYDK
jgi:hypothetical protein